MDCSPLRGNSIKSVWMLLQIQLNPYSTLQDHSILSRPCLQDSAAMIARANEAPLAALLFLVPNGQPFASGSFGQASLGWLYTSCAQGFSWSNYSLWPRLHDSLWIVSNCSPRRFGQSLERQFSLGARFLFSPKKVRPQAGHLQGTAGAHRNQPGSQPLRSFRHGRPLTEL